MNAVEDDSFYNLKYTSMGGDVFTNNPRKEEIRKIVQEELEKATRENGKK